MKPKYISLSRRFVLAGLLTGTAELAWARPPTKSPRPMPRPNGVNGAARLAPSAQDLIEQAGLGGKIGFVVADAATGKVLETHNPVLPLPPASTAKAITAIYALKSLGTGFRFKTRLIATAQIVNGRLNGDLILEGSGDPTLDTNALAELAQKLKETGLREVKGRFLTYSSGMPEVKAIDPEQPDHVGYNPAVSGLNLNFNRVHFEWKRQGSGYSVAMDARSDRYRPEVQVARMVVAERQMPVYTYKSRAGVDQWSVARGALGKGGSRWLPVREPGAYCADVFRTFARSQGIVLPSGKETQSRPKGRVLAEWTSAPLPDIARSMLKYSTNLTAETLGLAASAKRGGRPGNLKSSAKRMSDWLEEASGARKAKFVDHSGLGDASRISAREMVLALQSLSPDVGLEGLMKTVGIRDARGKMIKGHPVKVHAKTGTLNFVSALAGFAKAPDGRRLVFAIIMADTKRRAAIKRDDREAPKGGKSWTRRARTLQSRLIDRWATVYSG